MHRNLRKPERCAYSKTPSLQSAAHICRSYDIVGDIAIMRLHSGQTESCRRIAQSIMSAHRNLRTVLAQTSAVCGDLRLRRLEYVAGERRSITRHRESDCLFSVDVEKCYFSPRLSYERMRVARQVVKGEVIVNMFAGVGCFSILIAKHSGVERVFSIDINPQAIDFLRENVRINRVYGKIVPLLGDAREIIRKKLVHVADRVLLPLPEKATGYLPYALLTLKKTGGLIHHHDFEYASKGPDAVEKVKIKVSERLRGCGVNFQVLYSRVVRSIGPHWWQVASDLRIYHQRFETYPDARMLWSVLNGS